MRLDKYLAQSGVGKRKHVREYIKLGLVMVNNTTIIQAPFEVDPGFDIITYKNEVVQYREPRYIMLHKPMGCITAGYDEKHTTVFSCFKDDDMTGLFHVGRLDKDTEGLLLFTNDGEFEHRLMSPKTHVEKTYFFWALGSISDDDKHNLEKGVYINKESYLTKPAKLKVLEGGIFCDFKDELFSLLDENTIKGKLQQPVISGELTITEGKKHQVKKMLKAVGCHVIYLKRIAIGDLALDSNLALGEYRDLTSVELDILNRKEL